jgi:hypothetical protein
VSAPVELGLTGWFGATDGTSYGATTATAAVKSLRLQRTASWLRDVTATLRSSVGYRFRRRAANSDSQPGAAAAVFDVLPLERFVSKRVPSTGSIVDPFENGAQGPTPVAHRQQGILVNHAGVRVVQCRLFFRPIGCERNPWRGESAPKTSGCSSRTATLPAVMNNTERPRHPPGSSQEGIRFATTFFCRSCRLRRSTSLASCGERSE